MGRERWTAEDIPDQSGRTVLVTGANSGLGLRSAEALASSGARVLLACRNEAKAAAALEGVKARATAAPPEVVKLDLADLGSVRACAEQVTAMVDGLDVLMNNAGVMAVPKERTRDGFEMQFGTNHLGHFALTALLLPVLHRAASPRVVNVSSNAHKMGRLRLDDLNWERGRYSRWRSYAQAKLANMLFTKELARRAADAGSPLVAAASHPGYAATNLTGSGIARRNALLRGAAHLVDRVFGQPDWKGALTQLYAATMPDVRPDDYVGVDGRMDQWGYPVRGASRSKRSADGDAARALWDRSEELTGITYVWP